MAKAKTSKAKTRPVIPEPVQKAYERLKTSGNPFVFFKAEGVECTALSDPETRLAVIPSSADELGFGSRYRMECKEYLYCSLKQHYDRKADKNTAELKFGIAWLCESRLYSSNIRILLADTGKRISRGSRSTYYSNDIYSIEKYECEEPTAVDKILADTIVVQSADCDDPKAAYIKDFPYAVSIIAAESWDPTLLYFAPELEQLYKAGYKGLAESAWTAYVTNKRSDIDMFNRLCRQGTSPKTIFKTEKVIYERLKQCKRLDIWDLYRRMLKVGKLTAESVKLCIDYNYDEASLTRISTLLGLKNKDRPVFDTFEKVQRWIEKVDQYEALDLMTAAELLIDYVRCCNSLGTAVKLDSDSLRREHDVAARNCRMKGDDRFIKAILPACNKLQDYDWHDAGFCIRGVRSYSDLLEQASQMRNCIASYAEYIANGTSLLFSVRRMCDPKESIVTVQLNLSKKHIDHALMKANRKIYNAAISSFLDRWVDWIRKDSQSDLDIVREYTEAFGYEPEDSTPEAEVRYREQLYEVQDIWYKQGCDKIGTAIKAVFVDTAKKTEDAA